MILVSACLCGVNCKYNGGNNLKKPLKKLLEQGKVMMVCPEQLGGLETPRKPCEISFGSGKEVLQGKSKVITKENIDCTEKFIKGAEETLNIAKSINPEYIILKSKSPSCGVSKIYDGTFTGTLKNGSGVTAELLLKNGFKVITEEEAERLIK
ncbi:DUF523 domain-containing protein [Clostridium hydrogeniformans]|uniref:DUF523 domain-containing protein n=1 Tax=Clostridium hydrogeniformans TaxID=349933 RepID=UPI0004879C41|nr:DUF523 domain-containing protein [Clostridium hydrogeniformans]